MMTVLLSVLDRLTAWLVGCWSCTDCTWFGLLVNVVSCVIRAFIIVALIAAIVRWLPLGV